MTTPNNGQFAHILIRRRVFESLFPGAEYPRYVEAQAEWVSYSRLGWRLTRNGKTVNLSDVRRWEVFK